ncbi:MAG: sugar ABC transporter substrate-binding protein [Verrucomicrobia bacterium]|nr:sugar ABC transporter substrate-binding protein [Verrucomicrobiota bacterium]
MLTAIAADLPRGASVEAIQNTKGPLRIAFLSFQNNPFWFPVRDGAEAVAQYLKGQKVQVDYTVLGDNLTAEAVVSGIETAIAKKYNGIVVVPIFDGTANVINEAVDAGIPVVNIIAEGATPSKRLLFIGQDARAAGEQIGKFIEQYTGGKGKVGVITGYFGATQHNDRMNGAIDYVKKACPGIQIIGPFENQDKAEVAYSLTQDMLTRYPDLKMVYVTAGGPFGAAKAVTDAKLIGKVGVIGFDHTPENLEYLKTGAMVGLLDQAPFQQAWDGTVRLYNYLVSGKAPEQSVIRVQGTILTPESYAKQSATR